MNENIDEIVLDASGRGMDLLRPLFPEAHYQQVAARLLACEGKRVLIATGFYVAGVCETDGPPGAYCMAKVLETLGYQVAIVTDMDGKGLFEPYGLSCIQVPMEANLAYFQQLLEDWQPAVLISTERCGRNDEGLYANMRGVSISEHTAPIDLLFELAYQQGLYTVGIGDGGNEIGMGCVATEIRRSLKLKPCVVKTHALLIATVSNWGAYGLSAALIHAADTILQHSKKHQMPSWEEIAAYIQFLADQGLVDGVTGIVRPWVDGFPPEKEQEIYQRLCAWLQSLCALQDLDLSIINKNGR